MGPNPADPRSFLESAGWFGTLAMEGLHYQPTGELQGPGAENLTYSGFGRCALGTHVTNLQHLSFNNSFTHSPPLDVSIRRLVSWEEAKEANQIFLGRPEQNPALHELLPRLQEFYFRYYKGLVNAHPQPKRAGQFSVVRARPYSWDHAVVAFISGHPGRLTTTLVLGGSTTYGSQAAVEFVFARIRIGGNI